jgi:hypothetical protein
MRLSYFLSILCGVAALIRRVWPYHHEGCGRTILGYRDTESLMILGVGGGKGVQVDIKKKV